jgi:hypothetical protein
MDGRFGRDETCASLLALAARNTYLSTDASDPAVYSSSALSPGVLLPSTGLLEASLDVRLTQFAKQALWERCGKPVWVERGGFGGGFRGLIGKPKADNLFENRRPARSGAVLWQARRARPVFRSPCPADMGEQSDHCQVSLQLSSGY